MNAQALQNALNNNRNEAIYETSNEIIQTVKRDLFRSLDMTNAQMTNFMNILREYKYIESVNELIPGRYLRWIDTRISANDNYFVERGGLFCNVDVGEDADEMFAICRNIGGQYFKLRMGDFLFFQKLTRQEQVILRAIDMLILEQRRRRN